LFENVPYLTNRNVVHDEIRRTFLEMLVIIQFENCCHPFHFTKRWRSECIKKTIFPYILYGSKMWPLILVEIKCPAKYLEPKKNEVSEYFRLLHNGKLCGLLTSSSTVRIVNCRGRRWGGHMTRMQETRNAYRVMVGKSLGEHWFVRLALRWLVHYMTLPSQEFA
jgi:hypothetical protein